MRGACRAHGVPTRKVMEKMDGAEDAGIGDGDEGGSRASTPATRLDCSVNILFRAESDLHTKWARYGLCTRLCPLVFSLSSIAASLPEILRYRGSCRPVDSSASLHPSTPSIR